MAATIVLNIEYYGKINKNFFLEFANINCQFVKIRWADNRMSCIKLKISRIRIVNANDIKYPFQIESQSSIKVNKHQGQYGASLQGPRFNMDSIDNL